MCLDRRKFNMIKVELEKNYRPEMVESRLYNKWEEHNTFSASVDPEKKPYTIVIPPPNITGDLHMGHALNNTIQDILIRFKRMQGFSSLWVPGTDHAGIATQRVVEKELLKEEKTRWDIGREAFLERVWKWSDEYRKRIINQLKRMGCSCDWSRQRFTLDDWCSKAVREAFVRFYEKGYIYKGKRIINWCTHCHTALSDLEVEHEAQDGKLYYLHYPAENGEGGITIATTRPETILADTAVAVNPEDPRYKNLIGKNVILPIVGRKLPVIADSYVDMEFGTGALKITPGHDPNDFEIGERHKLRMMIVMDEKGIMNEDAGKYIGMDRFECRKAIVEELKQIGSLVKIDDYAMAVGTCYRCTSVIEPYISEQWFIKMSELAKPATDKVKDGTTKFFPPRFGDMYIDWMENLRDWCISRQLWWGHRIPVWYCAKCGFEGAFREEPSTCPKCGSKELSQDEFVLDTWFSSGLWPMSVLGWPDEKPELDYFYPTSVLSTDRGIIYLWVSRMMMFGLVFKEDIPFKDVIIHATVLNKEGRRMSKSLGTGVDPVVLFDKYGTDATRFGLSMMTEQGQDIKFSEERIEMSRNYANKIWNASRYVLGFLPKSYADMDRNQFEFKLWDKWILSRLYSTIASVSENIENYQFDGAAKNLYSFFWDNFCDWYIEITKPILYGENEDDKIRTFWVLEHVLNRFLRIAHPIMPFITEEIWSYLPENREHENELENEADKLLIVTAWPDIDDNLVDKNTENEFEFTAEVIKLQRNMRAEANLKPNQKVRFMIETADERELAILNRTSEIIKHLAGIEVLDIALKDPSAEKKAVKKSLSARVGQTDIYMPLEGLVDIEQEIERLGKERDKMAQMVKSLSAKCENPGFLEKAKPEVVEKEKTKLAEAKEQLKRVNERIRLFEE
jgi:valyl-tRNA synthetase